MNRLWRIVWGIVFLASIAWLVIGFAALSSSPGTQASGAAAEIGAAAGTGLTALTVLCLGAVPALIAGFLYWRNGVAMRHAREHAETIEALRGRELGKPPGE